MTRSFRVGVYGDEDKFVSSVKKLLDKGVKIYEVFTPYPVHEVFHLLKRKSPILSAAYFLGILGVLATLSFLIWAGVISWPIDFGGKPTNAFPSFVVITIVLTILIVGIGSLAVFSAGGKILPGQENTIFDERATDDKFIIVVETGSDEDPDGEIAATTMRENGAEEIKLKEFKKVTA